MTKLKAIITTRNAAVSEDGPRAESTARQPLHHPPDSNGKPLYWPSLLALDALELENHYRRVLTELGKRGGMLGVIFPKAQNKVQDPAKLRRRLTALN